MDYESSDGQRFVAHPLALAFFDPVDGRRVWIAQIKDCAGVVTSNKVVYADAFAGEGIAAEGIEAAVVYTYGVGQWHQDIVFTKQPGVTPATFGMGSKTRLEAVTEIVQAPNPTKKIRTVRRERDAAVRAAMVEPDLIDETLVFSQEMRMTRGYASSTVATDRRARFRTPVAKQLRTMSNGRVVLTESLPWQDVQSALNELPRMTASIDKPAGRSVIAEMPARPDGGETLAKDFETQLADVIQSGPIELAALGVEEPKGLAIDYVFTVYSSWTYFPAGTYLVTDSGVQLDSPCEFGGQCVFKFEPDGCLWIDDWDEYASPYLTFTAKDDDSTGEVIQGISGVANSTGNPTGYYGWFLPSFMTHVPDFGVLDFRYMLYAMDICEEGVNLELTQNVYLRHCDTGFKFNADDVTLEVSHPYACDVTTLFDDDGHSGSYYSPYDPPDTADCDGDYDNDGMDDGWEVRNMGSTSQGPTGDYDQDGLTNLQEYQLGTNPGNSDSDGDGLPDGWEYNWFGNFAHTGSELDAARNTLLYDYQNYLDPNGIAFSIEVANSHVNTSNPNLQLEVFAGVPSYVAVLVDNTNFASASWAAHTSSTITANLGSTQGWHDVWVGLKGWAANAGVAWQLKRLKLDTSPPQLTITSPASSTVDVSILQLAGYSQEALSSIRYDLENALVLVTNQLVLVTGQEFDRDAWENTINYFEGVDILLTNGVNTITLHATDLAGNLAALVTNFTLDYSGKTNLPVITLTWPTNDMHISGSSFTWDGFVTDPTATVTAQVTSDGGPTNTLSGMVERDGRFWVDDIPLSSGANALTLTVSDAMGNTSVTNISVVQSTLVLTVDPVPDPAELWQPTVDLVTGTISDSSMAVWVNGVKGTNHGNGTWSASNVPTTPGGVASFTVTAYESTDQQPDGSYGN